MKKETLMKIFEIHKTTNFCISTSNATGRGINGVSYYSDHEDSRFYGGLFGFGALSSL